MIRTYTVNSTLKLENKESAVITIILKGENISIDYALENGDYNILVFNDSESDVNLEESGFIKNGSLKISYIELNNFKYRQHNTLEVYKDSSLTVDSIYLGINNKEINFDLLNKEGYSSVEISNNVVCLKDSEISLSVTGNIRKGSKGCKCHQKTRCLTFENPKYAKVLPVLNIDECDVEASQSLSSGTIDEEVLFYMNSRGLSQTNALSLLLHSYLMPDDEFYKIFENGEMINERAASKVENIC